MEKSKEVLATWAPSLQFMSFKPLLSSCLCVTCEKHRAWWMGRGLELNVLLCLSPQAEGGFHLELVVSFVLY